MSTCLAVRKPKQTIRQWRGLHVRQGNRRAVGKPGETFGVCSERTDGGVGREPGLDGWDFERRTQKKKKKKGASR